MNMSRARRRWTRWDRYTRRCYRIGGAYSIPFGYWRVVDEQTLDQMARSQRRARRDAKRITADVLDVYLRLP